jgi:hypothetical protein
MASRFATMTAPFALQLRSLAVINLHSVKFDALKATLATNSCFVVITGIMHITKLGGQGAATFV